MTKKVKTKRTAKRNILTEKRVREIVREEIREWRKKAVIPLKERD